MQLGGLFKPVSPDSRSTPQPVQHSHGPKLPRGGRLKISQAPKDTPDTEELPETPPALSVEHFQEMPSPMGLDVQPSQSKPQPVKLSHGFKLQLGGRLKIPQDPKDTPDTKELPETPNALSVEDFLDMPSPSADGMPFPEAWDETPYPKALDVGGHLESPMSIPQELRPSSREPQTLASLAIIFDSERELAELEAFVLGWADAAEKWQAMNIQLTAAQSASKAAQMIKNGYNNGVPFKRISTSEYEAAASEWTSAAVIRACVGTARAQRWELQGVQPPVTSQQLPQGPKAVAALAAIKIVEVIGWTAASLVARARAAPATPAAAAKWERAANAAKAAAGAAGWAAAAAIVEMWPWAAKRWEEALKTERWDAAFEKAKAVGQVTIHEVRAAAAMLAQARTVRTREMIANLAANQAVTTVQRSSPGPLAKTCGEILSAMTKRNQEKAAAS